MNRIVFIFTALFLALALVVAVAGYGYGVRQQQGGEMTVLPRYPLIQEWRSSAGGNVTEIGDGSLTIATGGITLSVALPKDAEISRNVTVNGKQAEKTENLTYQDIRAGDLVSVVVVANAEGVLSAERVAIFDVRQEQ